MKKKTTAKKLVLAKETLRSLDSALRQVVGGTETELTCAISNQQTCGCLTDTCTAQQPSQRVVCRR